MTPTKSTSQPQPPPICDFLHNCYQEAVKQTILDGKAPRNSEVYIDPDVLSIAEHYLELLLTTEKQQAVQNLPPLDQQAFKYFMIGLAEVVRSRKNTVAATSFTSDMTNFAFFVICWLNYSQGRHFDVKITSRRKSLEGELEKILEYALKAARKACSCSETKAPPPMERVRDQYGFRFVLASEDISQLFELVNIFLGILTDPFDPNRISFRQWVLESENLRFGGDSVPKALLLRILDYYCFWFSHDKDFIQNPTEDGYQSWHATIHVDNDSQSMGGFMLELQVRTYVMHQNAEDGPAKHSHYEQIRRPETSGVFRIKNYQGGIVFYAGPERLLLDLDGLTRHAEILSRHASPHSVPRT